jgi:hypothetical protein
MIFYASCCLAVIVLRKKMPEAPRVYKTFGYPVVPILFIVTAVWLLYNTLKSNTVESVAGLVLIALGIPIYIYLRRANTKPAEPSPNIKPGSKLTNPATLVLLIAAFIVTVASVTPSFIPAHTKNPFEGDSCINRLRMIEGAKDQWALEFHKTTNDTPTWDDLRRYMTRGVLPSCPKGGTYTVGHVSELVKCSYPGHGLK